MKSNSAALFLATQQQVCAAIEALDHPFQFTKDSWKRADQNHGDGGGGHTMVLTGGRVFEKAGVNFSEVLGTMPAAMSAKLCAEDRDLPFFATGVSLVVHPLSPLVPTVHANLRYLEVGTKRWFGGGTDLTPYYLYPEDARHFHAVLKRACDRHDAGYYPRFKAECDRYFFLPHRQEARGIGGIFFDYLGRENPAELPAAWDLVQTLAPAFMDAYLPIVERRRDLPWTAAQKEFQLVRRGRYVEFNLVYDRGTHFGLSTNGRAESILMSLPAQVKWPYDFQVAANSDEAKLIEVLRRPVEWA